MKQFVPVTDEMLFDAANFAGPLVPYQFGILCARQLRDEPLPRSTSRHVATQLVRRR